MNRHLTEQEMDAWIVGDRSVEIERHVNVCPICERNLQLLVDSLDAFRTSVHEWSAAEIAGVRFAAARHSFGRNQFAPALAAILLCVLIVFLAQRFRSGSSDQASADAALLNRVNSEISQSVPGAMEPLAQLVSATDDKEAE